jgi:hypothetical protein
MAFIKACREFKQMAKKKAEKLSKTVMSATNHLKMLFKIASLILCLMLMNKKDLVKGMILQENIDILCLQEGELEINVGHKLLSFFSYNHESKINSKHSRVGCYINSNISYVSRIDLEGR